MRKLYFILCLINLFVLNSDSQPIIKLGCGFYGKYSGVISETGYGIQQTDFYAVKFYRFRFQSLPDILLNLNASIYSKKMRSRIEIEFIPVEEIAGDGFIRLQYFSPNYIPSYNSHKVGLSSYGSNLGTGVVQNTLALQYSYECIKQKHFFQFKNINYSLFCNMGLKSALFSQIKGNENYGTSNEGSLYIDSKYFVTNVIDSRIARKYNFFNEIKPMLGLGLNLSNKKQKEIFEITISYLYKGFNTKPYTTSKFIVSIQDNKNNVEEIGRYSFNSKGDGIFIGIKKRFILNSLWSKKYRIQYAKENTLTR